MSTVVNNWALYASLCGLITICGGFSNKYENNFGQIIPISKPANGMPINMASKRHCSGWLWTHEKKSAKSCLIFWLVRRAKAILNMHVRIKNWFVLASASDVTQFVMVFQWCWLMKPNCRHENFIFEPSIPVSASAGRSNSSLSFQQAACWTPFSNFCLVCGIGPGNIWCQADGIILWPCWMGTFSPQSSLSQCTNPQFF